MCLTPLTINRPYKSMAGEPTAVVPCGKCHECLTRRQNVWAFRLAQEMKRSETASFITLTYETTPKSFNGHPTLKKSDVQKFLKRLRKQNHRKIKYYAVGEYGTTTLRPHYHIIMFNLDHIHRNNSVAFAKKIWKHGHVDIANCDTGSIRYTASYILKGTWKPIADDDDRVPHYSAMSKNLGLNYLTPEMVKFHVQGMVNHVTLAGGAYMGLPRYYKNKIFSKGERILLAKEAKQLMDFDFNTWINHDFPMEVQQKRDSIRTFEKRQKLKNQMI